MGSRSQYMIEMITVLYFCPFSNNSKSGVQRYAKEITEGIKDTKANSEQLFWNREKGLVSSYLSLLMRFLKLQNGMNIVHFVVLSPYILPFMFLAKLKRKKIIVTYHGAFAKEVSLSKHPIQHLLFQVADRICRRLSDRIVSLNEFMVKELKITKNYVIIPNPVKVEEFDQEFTGLDKKSGITLVTATTFKIEKKVGALKLLCEAMKKLSEDTQVKLLIFGDGQYLQYYKERFNKMENIIFMGFKQDFCHYLQKSDAYVHISGLDNQPIVIVEAMLYRKPILCNNIGGISEMMEANNNYVVELDEDSISNGLRSLIDDITYNPLRIKTIGTNNENFATKKFSNKIVMREYIRLYENLLKID